MRHRGFHIEKIIRLTISLFIFIAFNGFIVKGQQEINFLLEEAPTDYQLYPRSLVSNQSELQFAGRINSEKDIDSLVLIHSNSRGHVNQHRLSMNKQGSFDLVIRIQAELVDHHFELISYTGNKPTSHYKAMNVVAGDAYFVYGQSNARGGTSELNKNHFIRTFGQIQDQQENHMSWIALQDNEEITYIDIGLGTWVQKLANDIIRETGIPVAFINGAVGGMTIQELLPSEHARAIPRPHYSNFLNRIQQAGLVNKMRAAFWWQGEANGFQWACTPTNEYIVLFEEMQRAWETDFGPLEKIYMFQPQACGGFGITPQCMIQVQEAQRQLALSDQDIQMLTTGHLEMDIDNCHFTEAGYLQVGKDIAPLVLTNHYEHTISHEYPYINHLEFTDCGRTGIAIRIINGGELTIDKDHLDDLRLEGDPEAQIIALEVKKDAFELHFDRTLSSELTGLTYLSHYYSGTPLFLAKGISLPQFYDMPIEFPDNDRDGYDCITDCNDQEPLIFPNAVDYSVNGIDEDCDGYDGPYHSIAQELDIKTKTFPNPSSEQLNIHFGLSGSYTLDLLNGQGESIKRIDMVNKKKLLLNLKQLSPGNYLLRIYHKELKTGITKRILKQ